MCTWKRENCNNDDCDELDEKIQSADYDSKRHEGKSSRRSLTSTSAITVAGS